MQGRAGEQRSRSLARNICRVALQFGSLLFTACSEEGTAADNRESPAQNVCFSAADCVQGECDPLYGVCVVRSSEFRGGLLEVPVPNAIEGTRNGPLFVKLPYPTDAPAAEDKLTLDPTTRLNGVVYLKLGGQSCRPSLVRITLSPVVRSLGVVAPSYRAETHFVTSILDRQYLDSLVFGVDGLPDGDYDVFVQDAGKIDNSARPECQVAPQLFRSLKLRANQKLLELKQTDAAVRTLAVDVPYHTSLEGYRLDIVHSLTGQAQSSQLVIGVPKSAANSTSSGVLRTAPVLGEDWAEPGSELVRLLAPEGAALPTVYLSLAGLEVQRVDHATLPRLNTEAPTVKYRAWVWLEGNPAEPVRGKVILNALKLTGLPDLRVELQLSRQIQEQGLLEVDLPPGVYTLRVIPEPAQLHSNQALGSQFDTEISVWAPSIQDLKGAVQSGSVIKVPRAATVSGDVRYYGKKPPIGTLVKLKSESSSPLRHPPGYFPYVAREAEALVDSAGHFEIPGVDCGACTDASATAKYTLLVIPPHSSKIPWLVGTDFQVAGDRDLGALELEVPRLHVVQGALPEGDTFTGSEKLRAQVYAMLDSKGRMVSDPDAPVCERLALSLRPDDCVQSAVQIAESDVRADGTWVFELPQRVGPFGPD